MLDKKGDWVSTTPDVDDNGDLDFGPLIVKGFSGGTVTSDFLQEAIRRSKEGQTMLLPGQYATHSTKEASLARLNLSRAMHVLEAELEKTVKPVAPPEPVSGDKIRESNKDAVGGLQLENVARPPRHFDMELVSFAPLNFKGWTSKTVKAKDSLVKLVHVHEDTHKKHHLETYDLTNGVKVTYCHHLKIKYIVFYSDCDEGLLEGDTDEE